MHGFVVLDGSPRRLKLAKPLLGFHASFDRSMILLHDVVQVLDRSSTLNTSFIERMNLTIRQGSAYLSRRTLSHARSEDKLEEHLELLRCHYNFVRPHGALQFGREVRTPAMQAGLATRRLTFREIFVGQPPSLLILIRIGAIACAVQGRLPTAPGGDELAAA